MKAKSIVTVVLLAFVGVSAAYLVIQESASQPALQGESARTGVARPEFKAPGDVDPLLAETGQQTSHKLIAYYFHRTQRCRTCLTMEAYAKDALREGLSDAFESGEAEWRAVNVEEPENEHFVLEYKLTASALVMVFLENGEQKQWKDLGRIWDLVGDEWGFKEYVRNEALAYLDNDS